MVVEPRMGSFNVASLPRKRAKAGIQSPTCGQVWIPAYAGMTLTFPLYFERTATTG